MPKDKSEFKEQVSIENLRHKHRMEEIKIKTDGEREIEDLRFNHNLQTQRIKTAEIRKTIDRRENINFMKDYPKK